jgi:hypothetical protein
MTEMCPLCKDCTHWHLADICFTTKLNRLFDNIATVVYSLVLNLWCKSVFLVNQKKHQIDKMSSFSNLFLGILEIVFKTVKL